MELVNIITKPLFTGMNDERMSTTNVLDFVDSDLRAKMLGDAIPAESFAAGANQIGDFEIQGDEKRGITSISFLYYLNPTSLDRNLEWDMNTNLCPEPGVINNPRAP